MNTQVVTNFKTPNLVSNTARNFAEGQDCTLRMPWCNDDPTTVVLCHIRKFGHAGAAEKPHDFFAFHGCFECHRREKEAGDDDILRAMMETQDRLYRAGILQVKGK